MLRDALGALALAALAAAAPGCQPANAQAATNPADRQLRMIEQLERIEAELAKHTALIGRLVQLEEAAAKARGVAPPPGEGAREGRGPGR